ncbi:MAG: hypothetical protein AAGF27_02705 [Pseudomonadota bacterium]
MAIQGLSAEDRFEASSLSVLNRHGIRLETGYDFERYRQLVAEGRPDHTVGDPFNNEKHILGRGSAAYIVGRNEVGQVMHTQAMRVLPTGNNSVADYFRVNFRGFSPSGPDIDFERSRYRAGPGAKQIRGRIVYSGEVWLGGAPGEYRGSGLSSLLGRYTLFTALKEFDVDYVVGFMIRPVAYKGFCLRMGFMHVEPLALRWYIRNEPDPVEAVMVYMSREDIQFMLDLPANELDSFAA